MNVEDWIKRLEGASSAKMAEMILTDLARVPALADNLANAIEAIQILATEAPIFSAKRVRDVFMGHELQTRAHNFGMEPSTDEKATTPTRSRPE